MLASFLSFLSPIVFSFHVLGRRFFISACCAPDTQHALESSGGFIYVVIGWFAHACVEFVTDCVVRLHVHALLVVLCDQLSIDFEKSVPYVCQKEDDHTATKMSCANPSLNTKGIEKCLGTTKERGMIVGCRTRRHCFMMRANTYDQQRVD